MPASSDSSVTRTSFSASSEGAPATKTLTAESAWYPSHTAPTSSFSTSPGASVRFGLGIPWTTSLLSDVQMVPGNPRYPLNEGTAPQSRMKDSASASRSAVVRPGRTEATSSSMVKATMRPAWRMRSISSGDLRMIMVPRISPGRSGPPGLAP